MTLTTHRAWTLPDADPARVEALAARLGILPPLAALLLHRGYDTGAALARYLKPEFSADPDGRTFKNGEASIARLVEAIRNQEPILVHGDYDVDGICGTVIYKRALSQLGGQVHGFLPSRFKDGYGVSTRAVDQAIQNQFKILLTADTGSQAYDAIELATNAGLAVIVTDHHQLGPKDPATPFFINPQQADCPYPYKGLSGGGVALKMMLALGEVMGQAINPDSLIPYATLSTVADVCPLTEENRGLVRRGLHLLERPGQPGLAALMQLARSGTEPLSARDLSHGVIPRLNAVGRLEDPRLAAELLQCEHPTKARELTRLLDTKNTERKSIQDMVTEQALRQADSYFARHPDAHVLVLASPQWHFGVVGIVAARMVNIFGKPAILLTQHQEHLRKGPAGGPYHYTGSGRAPKGVSLLAGLEACRAHLHHFGGHPEAVGLAIVDGQFDAFRDALDAALGETRPEPPSLEIDAWLDPAFISPQLVKELQAMEPTGAGNPAPLFAIGPLQLEKVQKLGGSGAHRALHLVDEHDQPWRAVHFNCPEQAPAKGALLCIAGTPVISEWKGTKKLEIRVRDICEWDELAAYP